MSKDTFKKPSEAPAGGDGWQLADDEHLGDLFLIRPRRVDHIDDKFKPGEKKEIIVADVVHINEKKPAKSEEHTDVWVFQGYLKGALRGYIDDDGLVLARLGKSDKKDRGNYPWVFEDATPADEELAREYLRSADPFRGGSSDDEGDEPKKSKKGKKSKK